MLKNKKGITLIALVVTIVVLLILAGVTISLLLDENGIIAKSKDARTETRVSQIEDEVGMWKQHNFINKESNQAQESADTMLANLISRKLLTEEEIDRDQELITIKKKDGTVITEISYGNVTINISKTPATEKSGAVVLTVDSVDGMTTITNEEEATSFANSITSLSEERKKEIIKKLEPVRINAEFGKTNLTSFEEALVWHKEKGNITEATEETFWNYVESNGGMDEYVLGDIMYGCFDEATKTLNPYIVTNPANETSNEYIATENGTYTFKIQDLVTGKIYTKKVEVTNVDTSLPSLTVVGEKDKNEVSIKLKVATADKYTKFEKAYIMYNNEKIDVTSEITGNTHILAFDIALSLGTSGKIDDKYVLENTDQTIILVKDNKEYTGTINMGEFPRLQ
ncbi:MAG: type II secretion system protein [Clostridium sp.]|nr:type II secretion system protein [Clostridium sp.]